MFNFGSAAAAAATPAAQPSTSLFSGLKFGTATNTAPTPGTAPLNLQFQTPKPTITATETAAPAIGLGGSSALTAGTHLPSSSTTTNQSFAFGNPNTTATSVRASTATGSSQAKENIANPKANAVPPEIIAHFDAFKVFLKKQREIGSEIACGSIKPAHDLKNNMNELEKELIAADNDCKKVRKQIGLLKDHMIKLLRYVDLIQKQQSLIMQLYDNPVHHYNVNFESEYFTELIQEFEEKITIYKSQFDQIEQMIFSHYNSNKLTTDELSDCLQKVQEIFVSAAGKLHFVHSNLQAQKRNFLELRRKMFDDTRNPFENSKNAANQASWLRKVSKITPGPTPFSLLVQTHDMAAGAAGPAVPPTNHF